MEKKIYPFYNSPGRQLNSKKNHCRYPSLVCVLSIVIYLHRSGTRAAIRKILMHIVIFKIHLCTVQSNIKYASGMIFQEELQFHTELTKAQSTSHYSLEAKLCSELPIKLLLHFIKTNQSKQRVFIQNLAAKEITDDETFRK